MQYLYDCWREGLFSDEFTREGVADSFVESSDLVGLNDSPKQEVQTLLRFIRSLVPR